MAALVIGVLTLVILTALFILLATMRSRMTELRSELREIAFSLRAEMTAVRTAGEEALARARAETCEEREAREAAEATRREDERKKELRRVVGEADKTVAGLRQVATKCGVEMEAPTHPPTSTDQLSSWWSSWLQDNMASFTQLWGRLDSQADNGRSVTAAARAFQAILASFPGAAGEGEFPAVERLLAGIAQDGPEGLLGVVVTHQKLVSDQVFRTAKARLAAFREKEMASRPPDDRDDGDCCGRSGDYACLGPRPA